MLKNKHVEYQDFIPYIYNDSKKIKSLTFQLTDACNLNCSYCYQINKSNHVMSIDTAKKIIDHLFENKSNPDFYFSDKDCQGIIIEFIGGEPLLQIDLIEQIIEYFEKKIFELEPNDPWILRHVYDICSNGLLYFDEKFQKLREKYKSYIVVNITVDGNKTLHDSCRLTYDGEGSYDKAVEAALHNLKYYGGDTTKITLSPYNINYTFEAVQNMINLGFHYIQINPAFEEGWNDNHGIVLYEQLKLLSNWLIDNDLEDKVYIRILDENNYLSSRGSDDNWCGTNSSMMAIDWKGDIYTCIRFMESSLGKDVEPLEIGNIEKGLFFNEKQQKFKKELQELTTSSQSTEECVKCSIQSGCSWCTGYNYQKFGTINHRATFICPIHIASALGTIYLNKKLDKSYNNIKIDKNKALRIISEEEYEKLIKGE